MAPESFAIARSLQQEGFFYMKFSADCGKQLCSLFQRKELPHFSFLWFWRTSGKQVGNYFLIPNLGIICSALCTELNACHMSPSFTSGDSPHCYTLSPAEASFQFYRARWEKNPKFQLCVRGQQVLPASAAGGTESIQDKFGNTNCKPRLLGSAKTSISRVSYHLISCLEEFSCVHVHNLL